MYDEHFDGGGLIGGDEEDDGFSQTHIPNSNMAEKSHPQNPVAVHMEMDQCYNNSNWQEIVNDSKCRENQYQIYTTGSFPETPYPDLLNMYPLPNTKPPNLLASLGLMFEPVYDPFLPLNLPPQPSSLYHSFPNGEFAEREVLICNQNGDGVSGERVCNINTGKDDVIVKHSASERQKRKDFNVKYKALRELIPNPTKDDRASIVGDTIDYINELKRTVSELKVVVEKKKRAKERVKSEENLQDLERSWVQRKSRNAEVDVRIVENDVSMKLVVPQRRINCLLFVAKALDELQLELHHVSGGAIGDFYAYLINSKICQGSNVYNAGAVANKVIQVVDQHYMTSN
ncbi:hypothetical protein ACS0TY_003387 [Phlomoides rotata]